MTEIQIIAGYPQVCENWITIAADKSMGFS